MMTASQFPAFSPETSERKKILICDDEPEIREVIGEVLSERYQVVFARDGIEAIRVAEREHPSLVILDLSMPRMDGLTACESIRSSTTTSGVPIIILTAQNDRSNRIKAFNFGADDFIEKPFHPEELLARIRAKIERVPLFGRQSPPQEHQAQQITRGNILLNLDTRTVRVGTENEISLREIEFRLLAYFMGHTDRICTREELTLHIWGQEEGENRNLDPHISALRKKIDHGSFLLKTAYGAGYLFCSAPSAPTTKTP